MNITINQSYIMRKVIFTLAAFVLLTFAAGGQDIKSLVWSYKPYPDVETPYTKAPAGYKPVYLANFARHGSRYLISGDTYTKPLEILEAAGRAGALTEPGKSLLEDVRKIAADADGTGSLCGDLFPPPKSDETITVSGDRLAISG